MNSIQDLEQQNLQDSWSILYLSLAKCLLQTPPVEQAEGVLRAAIRSYASTIGRMERASNQAARLRINLNTFFRQPALRPRDPRLRVDIQRLNEQVALLNVIRCPFATLARQQGVEKLAKPFCEEFCSACIDTYTDGVSQVNLSEVLTEPQNTHCRIAAYFRPANQSQALRKFSFSSFEEQEPPVEHIVDTHNNPETWRTLADTLIRSFLDAGVPRNIMEQGLTLAKEDITSFLNHRARCMEQPFDKAFLRNNNSLGNFELLCEV